MAQDIHNKSLENSLRQEGNDFIFSDVHYNGEVISEVRLLGKLMDNDSNKTHDRWRQYCRKHPEVNILTSEMAYQLERRLYALRDVSDSTVQQARDSCLALLYKNYIRNYSHTGTKITYLQGLDTVVNHLEPQGKERTFSPQIPEFRCYDKDWSYLVLAKEQPESVLGEVKDIPASARPVLKALFGEGYEQAGAVWQFVSSKTNKFVSSKTNTNLREVRLWTPTARNRDIECCVIFGVNGIDYSFSIYANVPSSNYWLARGWVSNPVGRG